MPYDLTKPLFVTATTAESLLSGIILSISFFGIPMLLQNSNEASILRQWRFMFNLGKSSAPPLALLSAATALGAAYTHHHPQAMYRTYMFIGSALATVSIAPFTIVAMGSTNSKLHAREEAARKKSEDDDTSTPTTAETKELIKTWRVLNIVRGLLPLAGSMLAFQAL